MAEKVGSNPAKSILTIMKSKYKILLHIIAISLFLVGAVILHVLENSRFAQTFYFFSAPLHRAFVFDVALLIIGIGFFIEFSLTFKPIKIIED